MDVAQSQCSVTGHCPTLRSMTLILFPSCFWQREASDLWRNIWSEPNNEVNIDNNSHFFTKANLLFDIFLHKMTKIHFHLFSQTFFKDINFSFLRKYELCIATWDALKRRFCSKRLDQSSKRHVSEQLLIHRLILSGPSDKKNLQKVRKWINKGTVFYNWIEVALPLGAAGMFLEQGETWRSGSFLRPPNSPVTCSWANKMKSVLQRA